MSCNAGHGALSRRRLVRKAGYAVAGITLIPALASCTWLDAREDDRYTVEITDRARFDPSGITIPVGATVVWRNMDEVPHTVSTDRERLPEPDRADVPDGAEMWDSGDLPPGGQWSFTFEVPGRYLYGCRYHQTDGMVGTITVEAAAD